MTNLLLNLRNDLDVSGTRFSKWLASRVRAGKGTLNDAFSGFSERFQWTREIAGSKTDWQARIFYPIG